MPLTYLSSQEDIMEGNQEVILGLLDDIRKAYGYSQYYPKPKVGAQNLFQ
jgi:hypothetical protein